MSSSSDSLPDPLSSSDSDTSDSLDSVSFIMSSAYTNGASVGNPNPLARLGRATVGAVTALTAVAPEG